ncbi:MAG TPA: hydroxymethylbilane synthase [Solirubrobacteraceae bacterium]|nr:hydroxymethylbilane synthase [Solirubrobacteraceae bacterium]
MRIGSRRSALALAQAKLVAELLGGCEVLPMVTGGDRGVGGQDKSRWVAELEDALLAGEIDLAVHSAKDVPGSLPQGLSLVGAPPRAAAEDVLCGASSLREIPAGGRIGTSSIRRLGQLRAARDDLEVVPLRGNVDTRLRRLADRDEGLWAIVLARAGLQRLGREEEVGGVLDPERFVPAPGQGILAIEGRSEDSPARRAAEAITDPQTLACLLAERALARELQASCQTPLGAHAEPAGGGRLRLRAWVGLPDGSAWASDELLGELADPDGLGRAVCERLTAAGGGELLRQVQEEAGVER